MIDFLYGFIGSFIIAGLAYWKRSLSFSGMIAAIIVGTTIYVCGSIAWFGTLIAFFISSTLLSKWKQKSKSIVETGYEKSGTRDAGQVFANGGIGVLIAVFNVIWPNPIWWNAFIGVMCTVNADTWATEIGALSKSQPRSILTGKKVPAGTSGGVSALGILATVAGGLFIGTIAWGLIKVDPIQVGTYISSDATVNLVSLIITGIIAGTAGSITDSLLGARLQVMYRCSVCGKEIERRFHCNEPSQQIRGISFFNNDVVNLLSSVMGSVVAVCLGIIL